MDNIFLPEYYIDTTDEEELSVNDIFDEEGTEDEDIVSIDEEFELQFNQVDVSKKTIIHKYKNEVIDKHYTEKSIGGEFIDEKNNLHEVVVQMKLEIHELMGNDGVGRYSVVSGCDDGTEHSQLQYTKKMKSTDYDAIALIQERKEKPYRFRFDVIHKGKPRSIYVGTSSEYNTDRLGVIRNVYDPYVQELMQSYKNVKTGEEELGLYREFLIAESKLKNYRNLYIQSSKETLEGFKAENTDPFLLKRLIERRDTHQPTDILVTIQKDQNNIVVIPSRKRIIVQGCAGSGKTMVMMQRLSRIQNWEKTFDMTKVMIITPSNQYDMFMKAVKKGLSISLLQSNTLEKYYKHLLDLYNIKVGKRNIKSDLSLAKQNYPEYVYSDEFITYLNMFYKSKIEERNSLLMRVIELCKKYKVDIDVYSFEQLKSNYEIEKYIKHIIASISKRIDNTENVKKIIAQKNELAEEISLAKDILASGEDDSIREGLLKDMNELEELESRLELAYTIMYEDITREERDALTDYQKRLRDHIGLGLFRSIEKEVITYKNNLDGTKLKHPNGTYKFDLYAILQFCVLHYGEVKSNRQYLCIDEGQDIAVNEYHLLRKLHTDDTVYNIFGDTNQVINPNLGITDWSDLNVAMGYPALYELNANYRNTNQITQYCNKKYSLSVGNVGIDGENVEEVSWNKLCYLLNKYDKDNDKRIALIIPKEVNRDEIESVLKEGGVSSYSWQSIQKGVISVMYASAVKGLEFDVVFMIGNSMGRNESYISATRAMKKLFVINDYPNKIKNRLILKKQRGKKQIYIIK